MAFVPALLALAVFVLAVFVPAVAGAAPAGRTPTIGRPGLASSRYGAIWYSATVRVPASAIIGADIRYVVGAATSASVCFALIRTSNRADAYGSAVFVTLPRGRTTHVVVSPGENPPVLTFGTPLQQQRTTSSEPRRCDIAVATRPGDERIDIVAFASADGTITGNQIALHAGRGSRIIAESSGRGSILRREDAFDGPVMAQTYTGTEGGHVSSDTGFLAMVSATSTVQFNRSGVTLLTTVPTSPRSPVGIGSWQGGLPSILSVDAPDRPTTAPDTIVRAGPPGRYDFRIDALVAPFVFGATATAPSVGVIAGKAPIAVLAAADVDFPACTARRIRVIARARDHHPICGP